MFKNVSEAGNHYNLNICEAEAEAIRNSRSPSATVNCRLTSTTEDAVSKINQVSAKKEMKCKKQIDHLLQNGICFR